MKGFNTMHNELINHFLYRTEISRNVIIRLKIAVNFIRKIFNCMAENIFKINPINSK